MSEPCKASAVICTLDRGPKIDLTIQSLLAQDLAPETFEIVIIDNGSRPENAKALEIWSETGRVRYLREEVLGESAARNCALREAHGEIIAFIDDDAMASPDWLRTIVEAFDLDPKLGVLGGRVRLRYEVPPPDWIDTSLELYLSAFDPSPDRCRLSYMEYPRGANMAFRTAVFEVAGFFSERFGRKGSCLLSCSETEMCYRIEEAGWGIGYLPQAMVDHLVPGQRMERQWFAERIYWQGRSVGLLELTHFGRLHLLKRMPGQIWKWLRKGAPHCRLHSGYLAVLPRVFMPMR